MLPTDPTRFIAMLPPMIFGSLSMISTGAIALTTVKTGRGVIGLTMLMLVLSITKTTTTTTTLFHCFHTLDYGLTTRYDFTSKFAPTKHQLKPTKGRLWSCYFNKKLEAEDKIFQIRSVTWAWPPLSTFMLHLSHNLSQRLAWTLSPLWTGADNLKMFSQILHFDKIDKFI